ncbi:MAG: heat shock protein transcriptional repressor HspR [Actinomycetota bacterium]|jgi:MerR family transcriptional regulator/heat shock protein HspR
MAEKRSRQETVYVISVAAELAGMHPQTLRIYERRGLVNPGRTTGGNRRYTDADIARLRRIAQLAADGLNLEGIRMVMQLEDEVAELRRQVAELRGRVNGEPARGEIVPLRQAVVVFGQRPSIFDRDRY